MLHSTYSDHGHRERRNPADAMYFNVSHESIREHAPKGPFREKLDVPMIPQRIVVGVAAAGQGDKQVLDVAVVGRRHDDETARLCDADHRSNEGARRVAMLDNFKRHDGIEGTESARVMAHVKLPVGMRALGGGDAAVGAVNSDSLVSERDQAGREASGPAAEIEDATTSGDGAFYCGPQVSGRSGLLVPTIGVFVARGRTHVSECNSFLSVAGRRGTRKSVSAAHAA